MASGRPYDEWCRDPAEYEGFDWDGDRCECGGILIWHAEYVRDAWFRPTGERKHEQVCECCGRVAAVDWDFG